MTTIINADCLDALREMPDNSVDAICTDPPYGLSNTSPDKVTETIVRWASGDREYVPQGKGFMGAAWDGFVPPPAVWDECFRVLKPGGHMAVFAGTRTMDLMTLGVRLAGFDIRDSLAWLYGSGFPKSQDVSKAIDRKRDEDAAPRAAVTAWTRQQCEALGWNRKRLCEAFGVKNQPIQSWTETNPTRAVIPTWENWQKLKALVGFSDDMDAEVWRLNGNKGKPGANWDKREVIGTQKASITNGGWREMEGRNDHRSDDFNVTAPATDAAKQWSGWGSNLKPAFEPIILARKPFPGTIASNVMEYGTGAINIDATRITAKPLDDLDAPFKYGAKAPKRERPSYVDDDGNTIQHSTVKPLSIMRWLCKLIVPPGGTVLDPFAGSGTTVEAAILEGFNPVGIEAHTPYIPLIHQRVARAEQGQAALNIA